MLDIDVRQLIDELALKYPKEALTEIIHDGIAKGILDGLAGRKITGTIAGIPVDITIA
jgi:hypothetical protein